jgi:hypothetical protein
VLITRDATGQTSTVYGSTNSEQDDNFAWGERVTNTWSPDTDWMGVRIERVFGEDPHIVVKFRHSEHRRLGSSTTASTARATTPTAPSTSTS